MAEMQQLVATSSDRQVNMARTTQPAGNLDDENQASKFVNDEEIQVQREEENSLAMKDQYWRYLPLFKAALRGDWESTKRIFDQDEGAITARINTNFETALSVAVGTGEAGVHFVEKLVEMMPAKALALPSGQGNTALHTAALVGNTKAAVILVEKHSALLYIPGNFNSLPIHLAAQNAHKDTLQYLLSVTKDDPVSMPFAFQPGLTLFLEVIYSGFFDVAVNLVRRYPELARIRHYNGNSALEVIAAKESAFASGSHLNSWQRVIYKYVPVKLENYAKDHNRGDIENPINNCKVVAKKYRWARFAPFYRETSLFLGAKNGKPCFGKSLNY